MTEHSESESLLPEPTEFDHILRSVEAASSVLGPVATSAIRGFTTPRRLRRLEAAIKVFDAEFNSLVNEIAEGYVASEEFEDLAIEAFQRIIRERDEEKIRYYGRILAGMAAAPDDPYDSKLDVLRAMEQLHPVHIQAIRACMPPLPGQSRESGRSYVEILQNLLKEPDRSRVEETVQRLIDLRIIDESSWNVIQLTPTSIDSDRVITRFGHAFIRFLGR